MSCVSFFCRFGNDKLLMIPTMCELSFDVTTPHAIQAWHQTVHELSAAGWYVEQGSDVLRIKASPSDKQGVLIQANKEVQNNAPMADGFAVLQALGAGQLECDLAQSVPGGITVDNIIIGMNWTLIRAGDLCGVARSPDRQTEGARSIRPVEGFADYDLADLAGFLKSTDPLSRSLGLAAVNTYWNRPAANYPGVKTWGGLSTLEPPGDGVVVIGGFRDILNRLPRAVIVEREPVGQDISVDNAGAVIANARTLVITAQTLMNASLAPLLAGATQVPHRLLMGPTAPLCPLLLDHGLNEVSALIITDPEAAESFVSQSGAMIMLDHLSRTVHLGHTRRH